MDKSTAPTVSFKKSLFWGSVVILVPQSLVVAGLALLDFTNSVSAFNFALGYVLSFGCFWLALSRYKAGLIAPILWGCVATIALASYRLEIVAYFQKDIAVQIPLAEALEGEKNTKYFEFLDGQLLWQNAMRSKRSVSIPASYGGVAVHDSKFDVYPIVPDDWSPMDPVPLWGIVEPPRRVHDLQRGHAISGVSVDDSKLRHYQRAIDDVKRKNDLVSHPQARVIELDFRKKGYANRIGGIGFWVVVMLAAFNFCWLLGYPLLVKTYYLKRNL